MGPAELLKSPRPRRVALWLAGVMAFVAIAGFVAAPPIVRSQAEKILSRELGRVTTIEKVAINPFAPSITLSGFQLREADGAQPFVTFDELHVRASYTSLWRLAPVIDAVRLTRPHVRIVHTAGRFNFTDIQDRLARQPAPEEPSKPARFAVYNIEVLGGRVDVDDRVVAQKFELSELDVGLPFLSNLESHRQVFVEPRFSAKVNGAVIQAKARSTPFSEGRESVIRLDLQGFDLTPFVRYSPVPLPLRLGSAKLDLDLDVNFAQPPGKAPSVVVTGRTELKSVAADFPDGGPMLRLASFAAELAAVEPLAGRYELTRLAMTSPEVWVRRDKDGEFALARLFVVPPSKPAAAPAAAPAPAQALRYRIDAFTVDGAQVHWLDERGSRPIALDLRDLRAAVRNVSSAPGSRFSFEVSAVSDKQEAFALDGQAVLQPIDVSGRFSATKLALPRLWPLAEPYVAAELTSGRLDAGASFSYRGAAAALALDGVRASAVDIVMRQPGAKRDFLRLASLDLREGALDVVARRISLGQIDSKGLRLDATVDRDGRIDLEALMPVSPTQPAAASAAVQPDKPFVVTLRKAVIDDYAVRVEDLTRGDPFIWSLEPLSARVENFSTAPASTATVSLQTTVNRKGTLSATGSFGLQPLAVRLRVDARALDLTPVQRFVDDRVNATLTSGLLSASGQVGVNASPGTPLRASYAGDLDLAGFGAVDKLSQRDLLTWKSLSVRGIEADLEPLKLSIGSVALADFYSRLIVNPDGSLNLQNILVAPTRAPGTAADTSRKPADIRVGKVTVQGGNVNFSDFFIKPNYSAKLTGIAGSITEMSAQTAADLELRGKVDNAAPVEITGRLNALAKDLQLDIKASARDIELSPLTPYAAKYAGYGIEKGKLSVSLRYTVEDRKLAAENKVRLDQLTFGDKVESPTATQLPVLLAVSLLKDRHGVIDVDLPISGSLDDPQFSVGGLIGRVIVNLLTKVVTAPFSALASAFGSQEELSYVEYAAGTATLDEASRKRLDALASALVDRPALKVEVAGRADAGGDREGLKKASLDLQIKAEKMKRSAREGKAPASVNDVTVNQEEYPALLDAAYRAASFPKPRNAIGIAKDLSVPEMQELMLANAQVGDEDLRQLANQRGRAAKDYLVETGKVPAERVFLVAPKLGGGAPADKGLPARAEFVLK